MKRVLAVLFMVVSVLSVPGEAFAESISDQNGPYRWRIDTPGSYTANVEVQRFRRGRPVYELRAHIEFYADGRVKKISFHEVENGRHNGGGGEFG